MYFYVCLYITAVDDAYTFGANMISRTRVAAIKNYLFFAELVIRVDRALIFHQIYIHNPKFVGAMLYLLQQK